MSNPTPTALNAQLSALSKSSGISVPGGQVALSSLASSAAGSLAKSALISGTGLPLNPGPADEASLGSLCGISSHLKDISFTIPSVNFNFPSLNLNLPSIPSLSLSFKVCVQAQADNASANAAAAGMTGVPVDDAQKGTTSKGSIGGAAQMEQQHFSSSLTGMTSALGAASSAFVGGVSSTFASLAPTATGLASSLESSLNALASCRLQGISLPSNPCLDAFRKALTSAIMNKSMANSMSTAGVPSSVISNLSAAGGSSGIMANPSGIISAFSGVGMNVAKSDGTTLDLSKIPGVTTLEQAGQQATALTTDYGRGVGQNPEQVAFTNGLANAQAQATALDNLVKKY